MIIFAANLAMQCNPVSNKTIIVPFHNGKDLKKGTFLAILKQAGIEL